MYFSELQKVEGCDNETCEAWDTQTKAVAPGDSKWPEKARGGDVDKDTKYCFGYLWQSRRNDWLADPVRVQSMV